ncbi:transposable element Tcb1 transposase [Trichonephila clavipes]|nr:transposable element Tcb1 transposase [Trichonephila clavipes]
MLIYGGQSELKRMKFAAEVDGTKRNRRATSTPVPSMVTASIGKAISAATVRRRLHMNGLYSQTDGKRIRIWRKQGTRNQPHNIFEHHAFRGGSIMVWAGISLGYRTDLQIFKRSSVTIVQYQDEILEPIVRLYAAAVDTTFVLMDDKARPHRADIVDDYLESEGVARSVSPAYSPDINPIGNL